MAENQKMTPSGAAAHYEIAPPFNIPARIRWIAQDQDGTWWGYTDEPHRHTTGWYENETGEHIKLGYSKPTNWENNLLKIK